MQVGSQDFREWNRDFLRRNSFEEYTNVWRWVGLEESKRKVTGEDLRILQANSVVLLVEKAVKYGTARRFCSRFL